MLFAHIATCLADLIFLRVRAAFLNPVFADNCQVPVVPGFDVIEWHLPSI